MLKSKHIPAMILTVLIALAIGIAFTPTVHAAEVRGTYEIITDTQGNEIVTAEPGSVAVIDPANGELVEVLPPSPAKTRAITVTRGCTNSNAGCWTSGSAIGDMQFAGSGAVSGTWLYRNAYYTGNMNGFVTFEYNGKTISSPRMGPYISIAMSNQSAVTGKSVTRW